MDASIRTEKFDVPTLVLHGEDDQIVPVKDSARKSAKLIRGAKEVYYPGAPHGLTARHQDQVNAALKQYVADGSWRRALNITVSPSGYSIPNPPTVGTA